jgi:HK97 family phage prohead protease
VWSHQWDNLDAHVGHVLEAKEIDEGLWIKGQLDLEEDYARRLFKKLKQRTIREFSFAYDTRDSREGEDGANELLALDLFEVGPTLKGANQATQLLGVKADGEPDPEAEDSEDDGAADDEGQPMSAENQKLLRDAHQALGAVLAAPDPPDQEPATSSAKPEEPSESGAKGEEPPTRSHHQARLAKPKPFRVLSQVTADLLELG